VSTITSGLFIGENRKRIEALCLAPFREKRGSLAPLEEPLCYRGEKGLESTTFRALLSMEPHDLGRLWPLLGMKKFHLYEGLSACQQMIMGRNLEHAACCQADEDFQQGHIDTFNRFGTLLGQVPRIHRMSELERSQVIYSHYLRFLEKRGVGLAAPQESYHGNAVTAMRNGHGRCDELSETLHEMLSGAGIPSVIVEAWTGVKRDGKGRYMTDGLRVLGFGATHRSVAACVDNQGKAARTIFDPAQYLKERATGTGERWSRSLQWEAWVNYCRDRGGDGGPLNTFVEEGTVREDYRGGGVTHHS
jgi:hypothetical protein